MEKITKIALGGEIGIGKSTVIEKLLTVSRLPVVGFMTKLDRSVRDETGMYPLYIYPASLPKEQRQQTPDNLLGACAGRDRHRAFTERFDQLATAMIQDIPDKCIVVMDELGFLESEAVHFKRRVMEILTGDHYVITVVKDRFDVPFLNEIRALPDIDYYSVTKENRDELARQLKLVVENWI